MNESGIDLRGAERTAAPIETLSRAQEFALTVTVAVVTANAYYIHPIIGDVARSFEVSNAEVGIVPALNQLALALGIFLLLPLGDRYSNKALCLMLVSAQALSMLAMAMASGFVGFTIASTLLGFVTIAPYLIPAFASKRIAPERLGQVTAFLTAGVIFGLLVARVAAGILAEQFGWRSVYWFGFAVMVLVTVFLPLSMRSETSAKKVTAGSYGALLWSVFTLIRLHGDPFRSALMQCFNFGIFTATWLALALHLTSDELGYGVDTVGYLAAISAASIFTTPRFGKWADRFGPRKIRLFAASMQFAGVLLLYPLGWHAVAVLLPLLVLNVAGPVIDVTNRMTIFSLEPDIRTRLTTSYVVMMFIGGAIGSVLGTTLYDWGGWKGVCILIAIISAIAVGLSFHAQWRWSKGSA